MRAKQGSRVCEVIKRFRRTKTTKAKGNRPPAGFWSDAMDRWALEEHLSRTGRQ